VTAAGRQAIQVHPCSNLPASHRPSVSSQPIGTMPCHGAFATPFAAAGPLLANICLYATEMERNGQPLTTPYKRNNARRSSRGGNFPWCAILDTVPACLKHTHSRMSKTNLLLVNLNPPSVCLSSLRILCTSRSIEMFCCNSGHGAGRSEARSHIGSHRARRRRPREGRHA